MKTSTAVLRIIVGPCLATYRIGNARSVRHLTVNNSTGSIKAALTPCFIADIIFNNLSVRSVRVSRLVIPFLTLVTIVSLVMLLLVGLSLPSVRKAEMRGKRGLRGDM